MKKICCLILTLFILVTITLVPAFAVDTAFNLYGFHSSNGNIYFNEFYIPEDSLHKDKAELMEEKLRSPDSMYVYHGKSNSVELYVFYDYKRISPSPYNGMYFVEFNSPCFIFKTDDFGNYRLFSWSENYTTVTVGNTTYLQNFIIPFGNYQIAKTYGVPEKYFQPNGFTFPSEPIVPDSTIVADNKILADLETQLIPYCSNLSFRSTVANEEMAVTKWLLSYITAYSGLADTGVTISLEDIAITGFTPAVSGTEEIPNGTNGSFQYAVTLRKGKSTRVMSGLSGSIIATEYIPSPDRLSVKSAVSILNKNKTFNFQQKNGANKDMLTQSLHTAVTSLSGFADTGVTATVTIGDYVPAISGDEMNVNGTDGSFTASVLLSKGSESETVSGMSGKITATTFVPSADKIAITTATEILNKNKVFNFEQKNVSDKKALAKSLQNAITSLSGFPDTGVTVTANIEEFVAPIGGTVTNEKGTDGSYTASVELSKGTESETVSGLSGIISATAFVPPPPAFDGTVSSEVLSSFLNTLIPNLTPVIVIACALFVLIMGIRLVPTIIKRFIQ